VKVWLQRHSVSVSFSFSREILSRNPSRRKNQFACVPVSCNGKRHGASELKRQIGLFDAIMLISGDMIGIGIFVTTGAIAETLPTPGGVLLVWLLGGLLALTGALTCAELSASLPYAGGDYIYIREAYGKLIGFLSGWSSFLVTFSGAIAFLAVGFTGFMSFFLPVLGPRRFFFDHGRWSLYKFHGGQHLLHDRRPPHIGAPLPRSPTRDCDAEYLDHFEDRRSVGNYSSGSLIRQREHRRTLVRYSYGVDVNDIDSK